LWNTQNYWGVGFCPLVFQKLEITFWKLALFPPSSGGNAVKIAIKHAQTSSYNINGGKINSTNLVNKPNSTNTELLKPI
jgi:hypothetical protein